MAEEEAAKNGAMEAEARASGDQAEPEKKKRGKPKDPHAPPKPKSGYTKFGGPCRERLKQERPELLTDLSGMGKAIAEEWAKVPEEEKARLAAEYEEEMKIWKPKWAAYKQTQHYKEFVEIKTDYLDGKARKKLQKTMTKDAPKRPKSGYMIYAGEIREEVHEGVKKEGLGLGEVGKRISERWGALSEDQKAKYAEMSAQQKAKFDVEFMEYRKGQGFKDYMDAKAKLEAKQGLKKIFRTHLDEAPKRPPSSYALYRAEVLPGLVEENDKKPEGEKLGMGDMTKKVSSLWNDVPEEKKQSYAKEAERLKAEYETKLKEFKTAAKYTQYLEQRAKIKSKENQLVNLRDMPKRPKSVFAMFAEEHKSEVEPGKGEGKGMHALRQKFAEATAEEKEKFANKEKELKQQWEQDVKEYKEGERYKTFETTKKKVLLEFVTEAEKVTTLRFLSEAPKPPPKTPFAIFLGEKRKADGVLDSERSGKVKRDEVKAGKEAWLKLDRSVRSEYDKKRSELTKAFEEECKAYMASEKWSEYVKEAKRLKVPVKSLLFHKKKMIKKLGKGMKIPPSSIPLPKKPDIYPSKPQVPFQIFTEEKKKEGQLTSISEISDLWQKLDDEERKKYIDMAQTQQKEFDEELKEFRKSDEGKTYLRELKAAQRRRRVLAAKNKFLDDMPTKPKSAVINWMKDNVKKVKQDNPELKKGFEVKKKLDEMWNTMDPTEKAAIEEEGKKQLAEYQEKLQEFKAGDNWKAFVRATRPRMPLKKKGAKAPAGPKKPDSMPKKPLGAYQAFCKEQLEKGGAKGLKELSALFTDLPEDEKKQRMDEAKQREEKYNEDLEAFNKSDVGRKYLKDLTNFTKKKKLADLKARFLKDEPKRPHSAYLAFTEKMRPEVARDYPEIKGMGPTVAKLSELWNNLPAEEKAKFQEQEKEKREEYEKAMEEYKKSQGYRKYQSLVSKILGKPSSKGKGKDKKNLVKGPAKPENMPKKPMAAFHIFCAAQRGSGGGGGLKVMNDNWVKLGAEGQKPYIDQAKEQSAKYEEDLKVFVKSAEGKKYFREKAAADKKEKINKAKDRFLNKEGAPQEPKRPPSAYFIFVQEKRNTVQGKMGEVAKQLTQMWSGLDKEERKVYEDKATTLKEAYEKDLAAYKNSAAYKSYNRAVDSISGRKAKLAQAKKRAKMVAAKAAAEAAAARAKGRGAGRGGAGRGRGAARAAKAASDSDSDVMGSDDDDSSSASDSSKSD